MFEKLQLKPTQLRNTKKSKHSNQINFTVLYKMKPYVVQGINHNHND